MTNELQSLQQFLQSYDPATDQDHLKKGEAERKELLDRFPIDTWPELPIERYALGLESSSDSFCAWMEFKSSHLGSIRGGSSEKLLIYKYKEKEGWYHSDRFSSPEEAWKAIRSGFVEAFELAKNGEFEKTDSIEATYAAPALRLKSLHLYFPAEILPVYSKDHLLHFLKRLSAYDPEMGGWLRCRLNRRLAETLRQLPELQGWTTSQMERMLYRWSDPRESRKIVKIAPGRDAEFWPDCLSHSYIRVGWDDVADLRAYSSFEEYLKGVHRGLSARVQGQQISYYQESEGIVDSQGT